VKIGITPAAAAALAVVAAIGLVAVFFYVIQLPDGNAPAKLRKMESMPASLNLSTTRPSHGKKYIVSVTSILDPIVINKIHAWEVQVKTPEGVPVDDAKVTVIGGMPVHQHGLPTAPRMTKNLGQGRYLLEGMKFNMSGWWELKIKVETGSDQDIATFNLILK